MSIEMLGDQVLIAAVKKEEKTAGGIIPVSYTHLRAHET